ncbi:tRNA (guanosine(46)-N7)-methyltransferase TrmB [Clostridium vitabionis]|uniref:tRNA (guanosine(46)-N7)-methyltransferase TrmB n=1 Tax=Clostridium vitabionis TaxID=2784388 RepID=UPI002E2AFAD4|nr:tRNA (guanosine(46)-N7)-methyltransferase TrmB [Clostridium vitabionis]
MMRLRHIPGSEQMVGESPLVIHNPEAERGRWTRIFEAASPIRLEIGMGKGIFLHEMAREYPGVSFIGVERYATVLLKAIAKLTADPLPNLRFLCADAKELDKIFAPGEVDRIYLNFSDPWPKKRHADRRLTSPEFLAVYDRILAPSGTLEFKTDNRGLFDYSVETVQECGWTITGLTYDLHRSSMGIGNVMTEYEAKFSAKGNPICKLAARR